MINRVTNETIDEILLVLDSIWYYCVWCQLGFNLWPLVETFKLQSMPTIFVLGQVWVRIVRASLFCTFRAGQLM